MQWTNVPSKEEKRYSSLLHARDCPNEAIENDVNIEFCFVTSAFRNHFVLCV